MFLNVPGPSNASKGVSERNSSIEQARHRKMMEEEERKRHQDAAVREKLRLLDAKKHPMHIQTHETAVREQAGEYLKRVQGIFTFV